MQPQQLQPSKMQAKVTSIIIIGIVLLFIGGVLAVVFIPEETVTADELWNDLDKDTGWFKSYESGEYITVRGRITSLEYYSYHYGMYQGSYIHLDNNDRVVFGASGDIREEFSEGDKVDITVRIDPFHCVYLNDTNELFITMTYMEDAKESTESLFYLSIPMIIGGTCLLIIGFIFYIKKSWRGISILGLPRQQHPQESQPVSQQYPCPYCGQPLSFVKQYNRWYCDKCKRYV
ncbi:MAG: hypothetical protein QMC80_01505 [Thermoplasmatales archaeon]|nr:hypothetical protein [Thermoplasmatales archaeon]